MLYRLAARGRQIDSRLLQFLFNVSEILSKNFRLEIRWDSTFTFYTLFWYHALFFRNFGKISINFTSLAH